MDKVCLHAHQARDQVTVFTSTKFGCCTMRTAAMQSIYADFLGFLRHICATPCTTAAVATLPSSNVLQLPLPGRSGPEPGALGCLHTTEVQDEASGPLPNHFVGLPQTKLTVAALTGQVYSSRG
jgi:hypothetical protein